MTINYKISKGTITRSGRHFVGVLSEDPHSVILRLFVKGYLAMMLCYRKTNDKTKEQKIVRKTESSFFPSFSLGGYLPLLFLSFQRKFESWKKSTITHCTFVKKKGLSYIRPLEKEKPRNLPEKGRKIVYRNEKVITKSFSRPPFSVGTCV